MYICTKIDYITTTVKRIRICILLVLTLLGAGRVIAQQKTYFGFGTNALYDVMLAPNLEAEVTLGDHWSVQGSFTFAWRSDKADMDCTQLASGGLEGRYWVTPASETPLAGHFVGAYANLGAYDLENKGDGYQCKNAWMMGVTYGYSFCISTSFRLQCSLGIGYLRGHHYSHYEEKTVAGETNLYLRERAHLNWFGPTKATVSFIWIPQLYQGKKGDRQ